MTLHQTAMPIEAMMDVLSEAAIAAGETILRLRDIGVPTELKADRSPVTEADRAAEALIVQRLDAAFPQIGVLGEEAGAKGQVGSPDMPFFLVDPLDGTREFVAGRDEFTVNIALVEAGRPVLGVVLAPALGELFIGSCRGAARRRLSPGGDYAAPEAIAARPLAARAVALASRSHRTAETQRYLAERELAEILAVGSSLKFCRLAEGAADLYPCLGPTMAWDTAAGQAVLEAAGGSVTTLTGERLGYGKCGPDGAPDFRNPFFVARGRGQPLS